MYFEMVKGYYYKYPGKWVLLLNGRVQCHGTRKECFDLKNFLERAPLARIVHHV